MKGRRPGPLDEGRSPRANGAVGRARHIKGFAGPGKQPHDRDIGDHRVHIHAASPLTMAGRRSPRENFLSLGPTRAEQSQIACSPRASLPPPTIENAVAFGDPELDGVGAAIPLKVVAR